MPFYKMMLGKKLTITDMETIDNEVYQSLLCMKYVVVIFYFSIVINIYIANSFFVCVTEQHMFRFYSLVYDLYALLCFSGTKVD